MYKWCYSYTVPVILFPLIKRQKFQLSWSCSQTALYQNLARLGDVKQRTTIFPQNAKQGEVACCKQSPQANSSTNHSHWGEIIADMQSEGFLLTLSSFQVLSEGSQLFKAMTKTKGKLLLLLFAWQSHFPTSHMLLFKLALYTPRLVGHRSASSCRL